MKNFSIITFLLILLAAVSMFSCQTSEAEVIATEQGTDIIDNTSHNLTKAIIYIQADSVNTVKTIVDQEQLKPYLVGDSVYMFHGSSSGMWFITDNPFDDSGDLLNGYVKGRIHSFMLNN